MFLSRLKTFLAAFFISFFAMLSFSGAQDVSTAAVNPLPKQEVSPDTSAPTAVSTAVFTGATDAVKEMIDYAKQYKDEYEAGISPEEKAARGKIREKISGIMDIREMARLILKNHWAKLKETERKKYADLLVKMVEHIGYPQIGDYFNGKIELRYKGETALDNGDRVVLTKIVYKEEDLTLTTEFYMHKNPKGWTIYDVSTDGDSLLLIYRNQHMQIIKEKGFDHLINLMRKKLDSSEKK